MTGLRQLERLVLEVVERPGRFHCESTGRCSAFPPLEPRASRRSAHHSRDMPGRWSRRRAPKSQRPGTTHQDRQALTPLSRSAPRWLCGSQATRRATTRAVLGSVFNRAIAKREVCSFGLPVPYQRDRQVLKEASLIGPASQTKDGSTSAGCKLLGNRRARRSSRRTRLRCSRLCRAPWAACCLACWFSKLPIRLAASTRASSPSISATSASET